MKLCNILALAPCAAATSFWIPPSGSAAKTPFSGSSNIFAATTSTYLRPSATGIYTPASTNFYTPAVSPIMYTPAVQYAPAPAAESGSEWGAWNYEYDYEEEADDPEYIFDKYTVRKYNLIIDLANLATLDADPSAEEYVPCSIAVDYHPLSDAETQIFNGAGCRYKGALGSLMLCLDPNTRLPTGGCRKLSWKVDTNRFRDDDQKIHGLKKLIFNGMAVDRSLESERVAYSALNDVGIKAPRAMHAELWVNGQYDGLYTTVENVDSRFTKDRFGDSDVNGGKGAVYKDLWVMKEALANLDDYLDSGTEEHAFITEAFNAILSATQATASSVLNKYFDVDSLVDVTAMNTLMGQTDDWRVRHNFKWFVHTDYNLQKKLVMIPWDYDRLYDESNSREELGKWAELNNINSYQCNHYYQSPEQRAGAHPASQRTYYIRMYENYPSRYGVPIQCDKMAQVIAVVLRDRIYRRIKEYASAFTPEMFDLKIDKIANQINHIVKRDPDFPDHATWKQSTDSLKTHFRTSHAKALTEASTYRSAARMPSFSTRVIGAGTPTSSMSSISSFGNSLSSISSLGSSFSGNSGLSSLFGTRTTSTGLSGGLSLGGLRFG